MLRYVARRLVVMFATLFVIISVTFFISKALPGTPFADDKLTPQSREVLYREVRPGRAHHRAVRQVHDPGGAGQSG